MSDRQTDRENQQRQSSANETINDPLTRSDVEAPRQPFKEGSEF